MNQTPTRRRFLRAGVAGTLASASLVGSARPVAAADTVTLSGTVTAENGAKIRNDEINASGAGTFENVRTDNSGNFEIDVPQHGNYTLAYYKADSRSDFEGTKNGATHIYEFDSYSVGGEDEDVGELVLPKAHIVDLRVLKPSGEPLMGADPDYRYNGWGGNPGRTSLNTDGYTVIKGASFTGAEFAGHVTAEVEPPAGDEYADRTYDRRVTVEGPTEIVATIDSSGATWEVNRAGEKTTEVTETTAQTTTEATTRTPTSTPTPTRTTTESGSTRTTTEPSSTTTTPTTTIEAGNETAAPDRGFFSNDADAEDLEMLNDPFVLTVGGFVLSAAGIAHQMLRGY